MPRMKDKYSIVTGAANGIGLAISEVLARHGSEVFLLDVDSEAGTRLAAKIQSEGGKAHFLRADISSNQEVEAAKNQIIAGCGRVDVLVNNAAFTGPFHAVQDASDSEWKSCIEVNLLGANRCTKAVLPHMMERRKGSIVNIVSVQALAGCPDSVAYTATKAALLGHTISTAYDYGLFNIRVNSLCPGPIRTRISPAIGSAQHKWQIDRTMLGRTGEPSEVAYAALFLASDESSYVTGATLAVDGGWAAK